MLRLPFIRATSFGHEVLYNWWGNGVPNGLRARQLVRGFDDLHDSTLTRKSNPDVAAREMRLGWLRDFAALPMDGVNKPLRRLARARMGLRRRSAMARRRWCS